MTEPHCNNAPPMLVAYASDIQLNTGCVDPMNETAVNEIKNQYFEEIYIKEERLEESDNEVQNVIVNSIKKEDCSDDDEESCTGVSEIDAHLKERTNIIHPDTEKFQCFVCQQMFTEKHNLENHINIHIKIKTFQCFIGICQRRFNNKSDFECHIKSHNETHDEVNKFQCFFCYKLFKERYDMKLHEKTHSEIIKQFECHICKKIFGRKSDLNFHFKVHAGIKDFRCTICPKAFYRNSNLIKHIKTHNPPKHKCTICHKSFVRKENLSMHLKIHNGKDFECEICKKSYVCKHNLTRHMKARHGEVKEKNSTASASVTQIHRGVDVETLLDNNCFFIKKEAHSDTKLSEEHEYIEEEKFSVLDTNYCFFIQKDAHGDTKLSEEGKYIKEEKFSDSKICDNFE